MHRKSGKKNYPTTQNPQNMPTLFFVMVCFGPNFGRVVQFVPEQFQVLGF